MGASDVSAQLWRERELLELLLFKLSEQRLVLEAREMRWVSFATREIEQVLEQIRVTSLSRDVEIASLAGEWGAPEGATLSQLAEHAPTEAWRTIFTEHRAALIALMSELAQVKESTETYLRTAARAVEDTLTDLVSGTGEYTTHGERVREHTARIVDKEM